MVAPTDRPIARFKDLCVDAVDPMTAGGFWSQVLDLTPAPTVETLDHLVGPTPEHTVWINRVPELEKAKNRVHLDIYTRSLDELTALGAAVLVPQGGSRGWTVMTDPEGGQFCAFLRAELPAERLHGLVVDCAEPVAIAEWWAGVLHGQVTHDDGFSTVRDVPAMPIQTFDFVPVPEPKAGKNRVHWDVIATTPDLIAAGATLLRSRDAEISWDVLADPEGNEFCVFA
jgi:Glyoxalase-like domain